VQEKNFPSVFGVFFDALIIATQKGYGKIAPNRACIDFLSGKSCGLWLFGGHIWKSRTNFGVEVNTQITTNRTLKRWLDSSKNWCQRRTRERVKKYNPRWVWSFHKRSYYHTLTVCHSSERPCTSFLSRDRKKLRGRFQECAWMLKWQIFRNSHLNVREIDLMAGESFPRFKSLGFIRCMPIYGDKSTKIASDTFLSFFSLLGGEDLSITGLSGWWAPVSHVGPKKLSWTKRHEPPSLGQTQASPLQVGKAVNNVFSMECIFGLN